MRVVHVLMLLVVATSAACGGSQAQRRDEAAAAAALAAIPNPTPVWTLDRGATAATAPLRVLIIGDTGYPGPDIERVRVAVKREVKDVILVAGDLVYPVAPACAPGSIDPDSKALLDERLGNILADLGAPTLLILGNHDVAGAGRDEEREVCLLHEIGQHPSLVMPARIYVARLGSAVVAAVDTNALDDPQGAVARAAFAGYPGWRLLLGHHTLKTYHDKEDQDVVRPWLRQHALAPDLYVNGHAHLMQFGVYDGVPAVTSGATAKTRERPACPPDCGDGQEFGASVPGYAMLVIDGANATFTFHDVDGRQLFYRTLTLDHGSR